MQKAAVASAVGGRMLSEIEEGSLEELLTSLRTNFTTLANPDFNDATHDTDPDHDVTTSSPKPVIAPTTTTKTIKPEPRHFPIPFLNELVQRHYRATGSTTGSATLSITGRHHELLYLLVATLIAPPNCKAVAIVDFDGRFDPLRLLATPPFYSTSESTTAKTRPLEPIDLDHVHILRPPRSTTPPIPLHAYLARLEEYMLYAPHRSREREWWGTIVIGFSGSNNPAATAASASSTAATAQIQAQVAVTAGWQGWLRVDRAEVSTTTGSGAWTFWNKSAEEARRAREDREKAVEEAGWVASSTWGTFVFGSGSGNGRG